MKSKSFFQAVAILGAMCFAATTDAQHVLTPGDIAGGSFSYAGDIAVSSAITLTCPVIVEAVGGHIYVTAPIDGHGTSPGAAGYGLTLKTTCGPRGSNPSFCGDIYITNSIYLSGAPGLDAPPIGSGSSVDGLPGGNGGAGGSFSATSVGAVDFSIGVIDTSGGNGGAGGEAGSSLCGSGLAGGGNGGAAGGCGQVRVTATTIRIGTIGPATFQANGGSGGHGGKPYSGSTLNCGSTAGAGGNGANGGAGGSMKFTATNIEIYGPAISVSGGPGGWGYNGRDGGNGLSCVGTNCTNSGGPVNGGDAGLSGSGGNGGLVSFLATGSLIGNFAMYGSGGPGGDGASGGSGSFLYQDCENHANTCCGVGKPSAVAGRGGNGGSFSIKGGALDFTASCSIVNKGGNGGDADSITAPFLAAVNGCGTPCPGGLHGGQGGAGGNGGGLTLIGTAVPVSTIYLNNAGGSGGNGGNAQNGAAGGTGGLKGGAGTIANSTGVKADTSGASTPTNGTAGMNGDPCH